MNILILNWRDIKNPSSGGAEILTHEIAKRLMLLGHSVTQFSSEFPGCLRNEIVDGVEIIRRGHPDIRYFFTSVHFLFFLHYFKDFKEKFQVIIDESHGLPFFTPLFVKEKKVILICEVADELWKKVFGPFWGYIGKTMEKFYLRYLYKNILFLTISNSTKNDLVKNGVKEKNITVLPMGVSIPKKIKRNKKEADATVLFVGRITQPKGIEDAIVAFGEIAKKIPKAALWVVGRGSLQYETRIKKICKKMSMGNQIKFFGFVSDEKKFDLMSRAHILIHPSLREGFGLTIPEAGYVSTPTVAYNSPGTRDVIANNINGILTQHTPIALAHEVIRLLTNKSLYLKLSKGAQAASRAYNWDNTAKITLLCLQKT